MTQPLKTIRKFTASTIPDLYDKLPMVCLTSKIMPKFKNSCRKEEIYQWFKKRLGKAIATFSGHNIKIQNI